MVRNIATMDTRLLNTNTRKALLLAAKKRFAEVTACDILLVAAACDPEYLGEKELFEQEPTGEVMEAIDRFFRRWADTDYSLANDLSMELSLFRARDRYLFMFMLICVYMLCFNCLC